VIKAITVNKNQLLMTAMLELIIIWVYCVLLFTFFFDHYFNDDIQFNDSEKGDTVCRSLFHCYMSTLNFGLRAGGGVGDFLPSNSYFNDSKTTYYIRSINDLSFFMIVIVMFFNIIFGIIIDTFAGLRDEKAQMDDDMRNVCFICSIDRQSVSNPRLLITLDDNRSIKTPRRDSFTTSRRNTISGNMSSLSFISTLRTRQTITGQSHTCQRSSNKMTSHGSPSTRLSASRKTSISSRTNEER
jgi:hypothetical protein